MDKKARSMYVSQNRLLNERCTTHLQCSDPRSAQQQRVENPMLPNASGERAPVLSLASGQSKESDAEVVSHLVEPTAGANDPSLGAANTAPPRASGSPGLVALRHELLARRQELLAKREIQRSIALEDQLLSHMVSTDTPSLSRPPPC